MSNEDLRDHFSKRQNEKRFSGRVFTMEKATHLVRKIIKTIDELELKKKELKKRKRELIIAAQPLRKNLKNVTKEKMEILDKELKAITKEKDVKKKSV